jgi:uncharacterized protein
MSGRTGRLEVEVVFALPGRQELVTVLLDGGATVAEAIESSSLPQAFPDTDFSCCAVGIWGRRVARDQPLNDGDRVEIYRLLERDPREARRELAAKGLSMGRPGEPPDDQQDR